MGISATSARLLPRRAEGPRGGEGRDTDEPAAGQTAVQTWGRWNHCRAEYYEACFQRARQLTWKEVVELGGIDLEAQLRDVRRAFTENLAAPCVKRVIPGPVTVLGRTATDVFLQSYRESDPQRLDVNVFHSLRHCYGQPVEEFRETVRQEDGIDLTTELVQRLAELRVLLEIS